MARIAIRGFIQGVMVFEDLLEVSDEEPFWGEADQISRLAAVHGELLGQNPHMIEIEFLDEPDVNQRFFRIGTDPRGMVRPIAITGGDDDVN